MRKFGVLAIVTMLVVVLSCFSFGTNAEASGTALKDTWYTTHTFPMNPECKEWMEYSLEENLNILNPPEDLLQSMTSEELAKLMMDYPHLWVLTSYEFQEKNFFWDYLTNNCDIYKELLNREDGIDCLLDEYLLSDFDAEVYNKNPYAIYGYNQTANAEVFGCQFVNHIICNLDIYNNHYEFISKVITEKSEKYSLLGENDTKFYLTFEKNDVSADGYLFENNEETNNSRLIQVANGFTATGSPYIRKIENVDIYFTPGTYRRYGADAACLQWYSGDYSTTKRNSLNNSIAYSWYRLSQSSPKYNCHGYAWLNANVSNGYWLDSPTSYMNNGTVTSVSSSAMQVGDIIVMYNSSGALVHSALMCATPSGSSGTYTISKIGGRGLYRAPLSELMTYYSCSNYSVYRP